MYLNGVRFNKDQRTNTLKKTWTTLSNVINDSTRNNEHSRRDTYIHQETHTPDDHN